ncbi:hypothetical protein BKA93DRAFT_732338 [Sparassis latifolia]
MFDLAARRADLAVRRGLLVAHRALPVVAAARLYSTAPPRTPLAELVAALRSVVGDKVSPTQAAEALLASNRHIPDAVDWLRSNRATKAAKKAAKVANRIASDGLIGAAVLAPGAPGSVRAALVELSCETDFVARNDLFGTLLADIAHTAAFLADAPGAQPVPLDTLLGAPLLARDTGASTPAPSGTVAAAIQDLIGRVGEKVALRRAHSVLYDPRADSQLALRVAARAHPSVGDNTQGRIGCLALAALKSSRVSAVLAAPGFQADLEKLMGALGRQIIGFPTESVRVREGHEPEAALYAQPFAMWGGEGSDLGVRAFLDKWAREHDVAEEGEEGTGVEVVEFVKWTVGESL